jgi:type IV pilus assembly protein PilC
MPVYEYEVVDQRGTLGRGSAEAEDQGDLVQQLRGQGQLVLSVRRAADGARITKGGSLGLATLREAVSQAIRSVSSGVPLATLVVFTGQLAAMLEAGVHLVRILSAVARESTNQRFRVVIDDIREAVTAGATLADSLNQHPTVFGRLYVAVVRAGEQSGSLPVVLNTLTTYLEKADNLRRKVKGAIAYPLVILSVAIFIVFVMLVKIVPIFEGVYARANAQLPAPTRLLIAVSGVFRDYTVLAVLAVVVAAVLAYMGLQTPRGRFLRDAAALRAPVFGGLVRKAIMARVCRTMALLLQSGIPLIDTMETVTQVAGNKVVEEALEHATQHVRDGEPLAETLRDTGQFPGMVVQLVATGEESGTLPSMLGKAALYYEQQVDNTVATLSSLIEPVLIVVMGAIAGAVIFALYLPIFTLGQAVKGGLR